LEEALKKEKPVLPAWLSPVQLRVLPVSKHHLDFCKKRSLAIALEESLACIEEKKFDQIVPIIQQALVAGSERDIGHVFLEQDAFDERMQDVIRDPVPTPWHEINEITQGGFAKGELWTVAASTGVGKSHWLIDVGHNACLLGLNVVHYTLELSALMVGRRYDARFSGIPIDNLLDHKEKVRKAIDKARGKLVIKSYPVKKASALTLKSHIHKLAMKDRKPDLIIIDYGDLMRSSKNHKDKRFEEEAIYEELRTLAGELQIPVVTATQTNRASIDEEIITLKHVAECFSKAMISDVFITIMRRKQNSLETPGNFFIAKNRLGPDGIKLNIMANTAISKFRIVAPEDVEEEAGPEDRLKSKFKEYQKSGKFDE